VVTATATTAFGTCDRACTNGIGFLPCICLQTRGGYNS
jgi:hypothetical protein